MSEQTRDKGLAELDRQESAGSPGLLHPKDRVRVTFESNYEDVEIAMWHNTPLMSIATVEVLERADDPTQDPIWTVREVEPKPPAADGVLVVKFGRDYWLYPSNMGNGYGRLDWRNVTDSKVVGFCPGSPAAEAERVAIEDLSARELRGEDVQTLNDDGSDEYAAAVADRPPLHVDNEAIVTGRYPEQREPRVFQSDGPEPPIDVDNLEVLNLVGALHHKRYLRRGCVGWHFTNDLSADVSNVIGFNWPASVAGTFREVV